MPKGKEVRAPHHNAPFQALRSAALAATVVSLAAGAHILGGGTLPAPLILWAVVAITGLVTTLATRIKLGLPAIAGLLGGGQLLLHEAFAALSQSATTASGNMGHHDGASAVAWAADVSANQHHGPASGLGTIMLAAHVLATLLAAIVLAKGEQALWQLAAWLRPLVQLPTRPRIRPDAGIGPVLFGAPSVFTPRPWRNLRQDSRRGPPAVVVLP